MEFLKSNFTKSEITLVVFFAVLSSVFAVLGLLSLFSSVIYMYVYYRHGKKIFYGTVVLHIIIMIISLLITDLFPSDKQIMQDLPQTSLGTFSNVYYTFLVLITEIIGVYAFLVLSKAKWQFRVCVAGIIHTLGLLPLVNLTKEYLQVLQSSGRLQEIGMNDEAFIIVKQFFEQSGLIYSFVPVITFLILLLNFLITTLILQLRIKFVYREYCEYLLGKIQIEFQYKNINVFILLMSYLGIHFSKDTTNSSLYYWMQVISISIFSIISLMYVILGISFGFQKLQRISRIPADWYIFLICIILLLPLINIPATIILLGLGIGCDFSQKLLKRRNL